MNQLENTPIIQLEELVMKFRRGDYTSKCSKLTYWNEHHIVDEELSVKENHRLVLEHNEQVKASIKRYREDQGRLDLQLHKDMCQYLKNNYTLNIAQCSIIVNWVYNTYHDSMLECFEMLDPIAGLCEATIKIQEG